MKGCAAHELAASKVKPTPYTPKPNARASNYSVSSSRTRPCTADEIQTPNQIHVQNVWFQVSGFRI